jgi:transcription initiation factor TFIIIB Brf1 subunit/transcription initiation factor TFIIB
VGEPMRRCCTQCGKVLDTNIFSSDTVFAKGADGSSQVRESGQPVPRSAVCGRCIAAYATPPTAGHSAPRADPRLTHVATHVHPGHGAHSWGGASSLRLDREAQEPSAEKRWQDAMNSASVVDVEQATVPWRCLLLPASTTLPMTQSRVSDGYASGGRRSGTRLSSYDSTSHEQSLARGRTEIEDVAEKLGVRPREDLCNAAARLYKLAVQRNFTRGRRVQQVRAREAAAPRITLLVE